MGAFTCVLKTTAQYQESFGGRALLGVELAIQLAAHPTGALSRRSFPQRDLPELPSLSNYGEVKCRRIL